MRQQVDELWTEKSTEDKSIKEDLKQLNTTRNGTN